MSRTLAARFIRPTLESLETRDLPSGGPFGMLLNQSVSDLVTQMNSALTILRSDSSNLIKDLGGITTQDGTTTGAPNDIVLQDYTRTAFAYGQVQGFSQGITLLGKTDLSFLAMTSGDSSDNASLLPLVSINRAVDTAGKALTQAFSIVNKNPSNGSLNIGFLSVLAFLSA